MPLVNSVLGQDAVARISFYAYNSEEDVDALTPAISKAKEVLKVS
jgi:selenocysteine lyase/cysteine desulfurase